MATLSMLGDRRWGEPLRQLAGATRGRSRGSDEVARLVADAERARRLRAYDTHPDVVGLRVERVRNQVDRLMWVGIVLGLGFTMTNVQQFAAAGAAAWSLPWLIAWLLDPMVSLVLIAVLRAEQLTARYQVTCGPWVRRAKWGCLTATYVMNTWQSWAAGSPSGIVLHSVPPLVVLAAAESVTDLRERLTDVVHRAVTAATPPVHEQPSPNGHDPARQVEPVNSTASDDRRPVNARTGSRPGSGGGRKLLADYVADARQALANDPDVEVSPAWARRVTGCSKGLSGKVAAAVRTELRPVGPGHEPPEPASVETPVNSSTGDRRVA